MFCYAILVSTALAALSGAPWWIALVSGTLISSVSIWEQQKLRTRFAAVGATEVLATSALASLATGCIGAVAAFALGRLLGLLFLAV